MKKIVFTTKAPSPIGPYNQAVWHGNTLYISGQIALNTDEERINHTIEAETRQVMENLKAILEKEDLTFENVLKCTLFVKNMEQYSRINAIYGEYFDEATAPARELVQVAALPKYVNIEISCIAGK